MQHAEMDCWLDQKCVTTVTRQMMTGAPRYVPSKLDGHAVICRAKSLYATQRVGTVFGKEEKSTRKVTVMIAIPKEGMVAAAFVKSSADGHALEEMG